MEWIDQIIIGILDTYETNDPYEILKRLEIEVIKAERDNPILLNRNCVYIAEFNSIFLRNDLVLNYELFYLRHELGHIIMHLDSNNAMIRNDWKIEKQANYFAFKLSNITLDEASLYQMTLEQISSYLELPYQALKQLI